MEHYGAPVDSAGSFEILLGVEAIAFVGFIGLLVRRALTGKPSSGADVAPAVLKAVLYVVSAALVAGAAMLVAWFVSGASLSGWSALTAQDGPPEPGPAYAWVFVFVYLSVIALLWWLMRPGRRN